MSRKRESEFAITEVITETIGGAVHVALSSKELNARQRTRLSRPVKRARYLTTPCKVDINLRINEFEKKSPVRSEAWLYVGVPSVLRFIRDLQPVRINLGQPIELDCEVEVVPEPAEIVWFRNGSELIGERYRTTAVLPRLTLHITRSLVDDGGEYAVSVMNADGEVTSTAPVVVLFEKPSFVVPLKDTDVHLHKAAQLTCRLRHAFPPAKVTWLVAGVRIQPDDARYRMETDDEGYEQTLTSHRVSIEDLRKVYTCHAINEVGEDQTSAKLIPVVAPRPPEFVEKFHDTSVEEGKPLLLLAKVIGFPRPTIKWIRNEIGLKQTTELTLAEDDDGRCQLGQQEVSKEMAGMYTCVAENEVGLAKCKARITVTDRMLPPIFIVNLTSQESIENEKVTFSCTVQGNPLPVITWYLNGEEVDGKKDHRVKVTHTGGRSDVLGHLTIDNVTLDDNGGELKAVAKNPVGAAISEANLIVKIRTVKPKFLKGPDDLEITEEENGRFVASVDGKPTPKIEWFKGEVLIKPSDVMIYSSDDNTHTLTIKKAKLDDKGRYSVRAVNVAGETTASAQLTVKEKLWPPVFTEKLIDKEMIEDDSITFRCSVSAKPPPTIAWIKDGKELIDTVRFKHGRTDIRRDEFGLSLTLADAEMTDCGEFKVVVKNSQGVAADSATLTVKMRTSPPKMLKGPKDLEITEHESGFFQATIVGKPEPTVQWIKDSKIIKESELMVFAKNDQTHSLTIRNAQLTNGGVYTVKAINVAGEIDAKATLTVNEKLWAPIFKEKMTDEAALEEDRIIFRCLVNAKPLPSIVWSKDGKEFAESSRIKLDRTNGDKDEVKLVLTINDAELSDCGEFKVTARNSEGQATDSARLIVKMRTIKPSFSNGPNDLVITEHDDGYFLTTVEGKPEPNVQWFKGTQLIRPSDDMVYAREGKTHSLIIKRAQLDDEGPYTVKATNEAGEMVAKATLTVNEKLWAPVFTKKMADKTLIEEDEVSLHCTVSAKPLPSITWLKDGKDFSGIVRMKRVEKKGKDEVSLSLAIVDAEMDDSSEYKVIAKNSVGEASDSARLIVKMRTVRPSIRNGPNDLAINEDEEGYFVATVAGKPVPTIEWLKDNVRIEPSEKAIYASDGLKHSLIIKDAQLHDAGRYTIKAINEAGETVASARLIVHEKLWAPIFMKELKDEIIIEEDEIVFQSIVNAKPLPFITWVKDGVDVKGNHRILCKSEKMGENEVKVSLTLRDAQIDDTGEVKVTARNSEGAASRSARLTVNMRMLKPRLVKGPVDLEIIEDDDGYFTATIDGKPEPTIQWYFNDQLIRPSSTMIYTTKDKKTHSLTIKNAQLNSQGIYAVKATNEAGEITAKARLTVHEKLWAPVFTHKMTDEILIEQDEIYFECTVNAKPLPAITWLKDGRELATSHRIKWDSSKGKENEVNLRLFVGDADMTDTGEYKVIAKNSEGQAINSARLTVNMRTLAPTLLRGPEDLEIFEEEDGHFHAIIEGKPEPLIQWLKDGVLLRPSADLIYDKKNQTYSLTIRNSHLNDRGQYAIKATNSAGELMVDARLTVKERLWAPIFKEKMADELAIEHDEVSFRCTVSAKPLPTIVWMKDGRELPENPRIKRDATKGKDTVRLFLTISGAEIDDSGEFEVLARNSEGEAIDSAKLGVKMRTVKPTLLKGPSDLVITEDDEAIFVATLTGKPEPTVQWYKNNKLLSPSQLIQYATKEHTHWLTIRNAQLNDEGIYTIKASNAAGELAANAKLTVIEKLWAPIFTKKMANGTIVERDDVSFRCSVSAKPLPSITWLKDGRELVESSRVKFDCKTIKDDEVSLSLYVTEAEMTDVGEFKVIARNSEGEASNVATLTVNMRTVKPILLKGPTDLTLKETEDGHFIAMVDGKPEPRVQWFRDNVLLKPSENLILSVIDRTHTLAIRNAQLHDAGIITVKAVNVAGEVSANARLTVHEKLWAPFFTEKMTDETLVEDEEICLRCTVNAKPLPTITWLKDGRVLTDVPRINRAQVNGKGNDMKLFLTISETEMDDSGKFEVVARNSEGEASDSSRLTVKLRTLAPMILKKPDDLVVTEDEDGAFFVTVDGKPEPRVNWFKDNKLIKPSEFMVYASRDRTHSLSIKNAQLSNGGIYVVKAVNEVGEMEASARLTVKEKLWPPFFSEKLVDKTIIEQEEARFRCTVNAKPLPSITWFRNGKELVDGPRISKDRMNGKENELKLSISLRDAEIPDSGEFKIVAKNSEGEASTIASLDVKMRTLRPTLVKGPSDLVIFEEEEAYFWATIAAKPEPTVQWFRNETLLRPSDVVVYANQDQTYSLILKNARLDDTGLYTIKAANAVGHLEATAKLTVKVRTVKPSFLRGPTDLVITEGEDATFTATVFGKPEPRVQWLRNGREIKPSELLILTKRDQTYSITIKNAQLDDAGHYSVQAVNDDGEATATARLTVNVRAIKPSFLRGPTDLVVIEHDDATFTASVVGKPEPKVQWLAHGREIRASDQFVLVKKDQTYSLTIKDAQLNDGGHYGVRVVNDAGEAIATAKLTVKIRTVKPALLDGPNDLVIIEHEDAFFSATIDGIPEPKVKWLKNGVEIRPSELLTLSKKEKTYWLTIEDAQLEDGGHYSVKAVNDAGELTATARLTVKEKLWAPFFTEEIGDKAFIEQDKIFFACTVNAKPLPSITWYKNDTELRASSRVKIESIRGRENELKLSLTVTDADLTDAGKFVVRAKNSEGEASCSAGITVTVLTVKPIFLKGPSDLVVIEHEDAIFTAIIGGKPEPTVHWLKNDREIKPSEHFITSKNDQTYFLTIKRAQMDDGGQYCVRAVNEGGVLVSPARLTVREKLWAPFFVEKIADKAFIEQDKIFFACIVNAKPLPSITWFKNDMELGASSRVKIESIRGRENEVKLSLTVTDADLSDAGKFVIRAKNSEGEASCSASLTVTVLTVKPIFLKGPSDLVVIEHEDAVFTAMIGGKPEPKVHWLKNNHEIRPSEHFILGKKDQTYSLTIKNAQMDDGDQYSVRAVNEGGVLIDHARLTVREKLWAPFFVEKIADRAFIEQDKIYFACIVNAKPLPSITWFKNDMELREGSRVKIESIRGRENEVKLSLTVTDADLSDAGKFVIRAKNSEGEASCSASLTVMVLTVKPIFLKGPSDLIVTEHEDAIFTATIGGKPEPTVQWLKNDLEIRPSGHFILGKKDQTYSLTIKRAEMDDAGQYSVRAVNEGGVLVSPARLTVREKLWAPFFVEKIADRAFIEQDKIYFVCTVNAKPLPSITWFKNDMELRASSRVKIESIKGREDEMKLSLTVTDADLSDSGKFVIRAKNSEGEASCSASLTVTVMTVKPIFLRGPSDLVVTEHEDAVFTAMIGGKPEPKVQWLKNDHEIRPAEHFIFDKKGQTYSITIKNTKLDDGGHYSVRAVNEGGVLVSPARLTVRARGLKPTLLKGPSNLKLEEGSTGSFVAVVDGKPYPEIKWSKNSVPLTIGSRFITKSTGVEQTLIIKEAKRRDAGLYTITATNEAGDLKASATLEVIDTTPYFLDMLKDVEVSEGMPAVFACKVYPDSAPVVWLTEDTEVDPSDTRYKVTVRGNERRLEIVRAGRRDRGHIFATLGELQSKAQLSVEASETEIVETRLLWKIVEDEFMRAAAEFECTRCRETAVMRIESMSDPLMAVTDRVQRTAQRRWVVKRAYISRDGEFRVDRWSVRSHVDYTVTEEGLKDAARGRLDRAKYSSQTVEFLISLMEPTAESRWLKDGIAISPSSKYEMNVVPDGTLHSMTINDVQQTDEGIYTFMVLRQKVEAEFTVEGGGGQSQTQTRVYHSHSSHSPGRLLSVKSRQEVDTEDLIAQLPAPIRKAKIGSKIVISYDNLHQLSTPSSAAVQEQLHDFSDKVAGFEDEVEEEEEEEEEEEVPEEEQEEVFDDVADGVRGRGRGRRSSLVLSGGALAVLPAMNQLARSSSLSSLVFRGGGKLGRAKSEIVYFAYSESGKDKTDF